MDLLKEANMLMAPQQMAKQQIEKQRQQAGMMQMQTLQNSGGMLPGSPQAPQTSPTGGFGAGGYQGAANALGPPVTHGKLGNGPGVNAIAGGQTAGGVKVGALGNVMAPPKPTRPIAPPKPAPATLSTTTPAMLGNTPKPAPLGNMAAPKPPPTATLSTYATAQPDTGTPSKFGLPNTPGGLHTPLPGTGTQATPSSVGGGPMLTRPAAAPWSQPGMQTAWQPGVDEDLPSPGRTPGMNAMFGPNTRSGPIEVPGGPLGDHGIMPPGGLAGMVRATSGLANPPAPPPAAPAQPPDAASGNDFTIARWPEHTPAPPTPAPAPAANAAATQPGGVNTFGTVLDNEGDTNYAPDAAPPGLYGYTANSGDSGVEDAQLSSILPEPAAALRPELASTPQPPAALPAPPPASLGLKGYLPGGEQTQSPPSQAPVNRYQAQISRMEDAMPRMQQALADAQASGDRGAYKRIKNRIDTNQYQINLQRERGSMNEAEQLADLPRQAATTGVDPAWAAKQIKENFRPGGTADYFQQRSNNVAAGRPIHSGVTASPGALLRSSPPKPSQNTAFAGGPAYPAEKMIGGVPESVMRRQFMERNPEMAKGMPEYNPPALAKQGMLKEAATLLGGEKVAVEERDKSPPRDKKEERHQARKKLGPIESGYIADAVGASSLENLGKKYQRDSLDENNPYQDLYSQMLRSQGGTAQVLGERIGRGASRLAENTPWRILSRLDPTRQDRTEGLIGMASGLGGKPGAADAKRRAAEAYVKFLKKHQAKLDPNAEPTSRPTPFHDNAASMLANMDTDIAGHSYMRKERPLHYFLNPMSVSGPLAELSDRGLRRVFAAQAQPDSTAGRAGMGLATVGTLGLAPLIMGGEQAQQKLRAAAAQRGLYAPAAMPEMKTGSLEAAADALFA